MTSQGLPARANQSGRPKSPWLNSRLAVINRAVLNYYNGDKRELVMMGASVYEDQRVRELFYDARFTVNEILERTGLTIDRIVRAINAPRVPKGSPGMKLRQSI